MAGGDLIVSSHLPGNSNQMTHKNFFTINSWELSNSFHTIRYLHSWRFSLETRRFGLSFDIDVLV